MTSLPGWKPWEWKHPSERTLGPMDPVLQWLRNTQHLCMYPMTLRSSYMVYVSVSLTWHKSRVLDQGQWPLSGKVPAVLHILLFLSPFLSPSQLPKQISPFSLSLESTASPSSTCFQVQPTNHNGDSSKLHKCLRYPFRDNIVTCNIWVNYRWRYV